MLNNITAHDQRSTLGWFSYSDQHGNVLVTAFPDKDTDEIKLSFSSDTREVIPFAAALHDTYVMSMNAVGRIAEVIYFEFEIRGY